MELKLEREKLDMTTGFPPFHHGRSLKSGGLFYGFESAIQLNPLLSEDCFILALVILWEAFSTTSRRAIANDRHIYG